MSKCQFCKQELKKKLLDCVSCTAVLDLNDGYVCFEREHYCDGDCLLQWIENTGNLCMEAYPDD